MSTLHLDAEALYGDLLAGVRSLLRPHTALVGIWSGGAWLAERLQRELSLEGEHGVISSALHRDDFSSRGMTAGADHTHLPFEIEGRHIVLVDRGGRELPIAPAYCSARITLPAHQRLSLVRDDAGRFSFDIQERSA